MKTIVQLLAILLACMNIVIFCYFQMIQAKLYSMAIILSCGNCGGDHCFHTPNFYREIILFILVFCPLGVIASICAFVGAKKKKPDLLLPLLILLSIFIITILIAVVCLIVYSFFGESYGSQGVVIELSYEFIVIPLPTTFGICFAALAAAILILIATYYLYKSQRTNEKTQRKRSVVESRPLSNRTVLSTDM